MSASRCPSSLAAWIVRRMFADDGESSVLGDMIETYYDLAGRRSVFRARVWFWEQCAKACSYYVLDKISWGVIMFKNYLLVTMRNLRKNGIYSVLKIAGLAVGIAAFILIILYVRFETSFDRYHPNADRVYRVVCEETATTPAPLGAALKEKIPEIAAVARIIRTPHTLIAHEASQFLEDDFYWAEPGTIPIFSLAFIAGDPRTALDDPSAVVLSESNARKYFGTADALGKRLTVGEKHEFNVTGVFKDMPANSHFIMRAVVPYNTYFRMIGGGLNEWTAHFTYTYVLLAEEADSKATAYKIASAIEAPLLQSWGVKEPYPRYFFLQPLADIHLRSHLRLELQGNSDTKYIILLSSVALLILVIACINYMNLAMARSLRRGKEVGLRKVVGARKGQLVAQYIGESVGLSALSTLAAVALIFLALPAFNNLVERNLSFQPVQSPKLILGLVLLTLLVGTAAGLYPAMRMSSFRPISILRGAFSPSRKGASLRNVLVLFQFAATIALIVCTLAIREQMRFIRTADMGFSREQIVTFSVRGESIRRSMESIRTELLRYPDIRAVAASNRLPNNIEYYMNTDWTGRNTEDRPHIYYNAVSYDFVRLFGLEIVQGRDFSRDFPSDETGAFLVNETAVKVAGWESPLGRKFTDWRDRTGTVVGVIKDFHSQSLHHPISPLYLFIDPRVCEMISIKIDTTDIPATLDHVKGVFRKYAPGTPFAFSFFDETFERAYASEQRMGRTFGGFSILAVFIACLGLFGLTAFAAEQRTREVGIRKVLGASASSVFLLLSREFIGWVALANVLAWPVAWMIMNKWLRSFAYRINLGIVPFLISGATALAIAYLTVSWQSVKSARANPVDSIRYH